MKIRDRSTLALFDSRHSNADRAPIAVWIDPDEPDGDNFAGGGGAKLGIKNAYETRGILRRAPGVAVNHWPEALAMYQANHPECQVLCEDICKIDPAVASRGKRYALAWFSPTCIYFSQAKGGPLDEEATKVRGLAWMAVAWAASEARPRVICLENVKQFMSWGPLHRRHNNGCSAELAAARGTTFKNGKFKPKCLKGCCYLRPIKARRGQLFQAFINRLGSYYRHVSYRVLKASDYGAPTSRERFFLIASDKPVHWPEPTHGPGRSKPHRTAAECIDWTIPCPSIFERSKPLVDTTLDRIRAGVHRYVFGAARPFIVHVTHGARAHSIDNPSPTLTGANRGELGLVSPLVLKAKTYGGGGNDAKPANVPLGSILTSKRGEHAIATPILTHVGNGERPGQELRAHSVQKPLKTIMAKRINAGLAMPILVKGYSEREGGAAGAQAVDKPIGTITQRDHNWLAMPNMLKLRGTSDSHVEASASPIDQPITTIAAQGTHHAIQAVYLIRYNGTSDAESLERPLSTIDTRDRFALVTISMERDVSERAMRVAAFLGFDAPIVLEIDGERWVLVDIGFRMLGAPELFLCQGFPRDYKIDVLFRGKRLSKTAQIKCVGNSVPPQLAEAVAGAAIETVEYEPGYARAA